jgi:hypothetical protein
MELLVLLRHRKTCGVLDQRQEMGWESSVLFQNYRSCVGIITEKQESKCPLWES